LASWLALFPFLPAMISNKWNVRALDRYLLQFYLHLSWIISITTHSLWCYHQSHWIRKTVWKRYSTLTKTGSVALDNIIMCSNRNDGNQFLCKQQQNSLHFYQLATAQFAITSTKKNVRVALWTVPDLRSVLSDVTP